MTSIGQVSISITPFNKRSRSSRSTSPRNNVEIAERQSPKAKIARPRAQSFLPPCYCNLRNNDHIQPNNYFERGGPGLLQNLAAQKHTFLNTIEEPESSPTEKFHCAGLQVPPKIPSLNLNAFRKHLIVAELALKNAQCITTIEQLEVISFQLGHPVTRSPQLLCATNEGSQAALSVLLWTSERVLGCVGQELLRRQQSTLQHYSPIENLPSCSESCRSLFNSMMNILVERLPRIPGCEFLLQFVQGLLFYHKENLWIQELALCYIIGMLRELNSSFITYDAVDLSWTEHFILEQQEVASNAQAWVLAQAEKMLEVENHASSGVELGDALLRLHMFERQNSVHRAQGTGYHPDITGFVWIQLFGWITSSVHQIVQGGHTYAVAIDPVM